MATIKSFTSLKQSKKLAEILPIESADMWWLYVTAQGKHIAMMYEEPDPHYIARMESYGIKDAAIRCWSLAALLDILNKSTYFANEAGIVELSSIKATKWCVSILNCGKIENCYTDNPVDACVAMIEHLHKLNLL